MNIDTFIKSQECPCLPPEIFLEELPVKLNEQQIRAMTAKEGANLILAVPGSGKTTVLVARLGYLINCLGIAPENILTVTYTVAACREMQKRFARFFGDDLASRLEFRTINGICAKVLLFYGRKIGKKSFELVTEDRMSAILADIYHKVEGEFATEGDISLMKSAIALIKNQMMDEKEIQDYTENEEIPFDLPQIYEAYGQTLRENALIDYDDQLVYAYKILKGSQQTLEAFQNRYQHILVDEAQDASLIQHKIIALLARKSKKLFMVGDEDQSIYGFRAAYPKALVDFQKDWPGASVVLMETNYRSMEDIIRKAGKLIRKNRMRYEKRMVPCSEHKSPEKCVSLVSAKTRGAQYAQICEELKGFSGTTAVLYRDNECAIPLADLLDRKGIPFTLMGSNMIFFSHRILQDVRDILALSYDPTNGEAFLKVYYKIGLRIKKQDAQRLSESAIKRKEKIYVLAAKDPQLPSYASKAIREAFYTLSEISRISAREAIQDIRYGLRYDEYLNQRKMDKGKLDILTQLSAREKTAKDLMDRLKYLEENLPLKKQERTSLFLSTIHASKGLEYDRVYILDVVNGILPGEIPQDWHDLSPEEEARLEEERRLLYVGITRAKRELTIFQYKESQFLKELKAVSESDKKAILTGLTPGKKVYHVTLGEGVVVSVDESYISIRFQGKVRKLNLHFLLSHQMLRETED